MNTGKAFKHHITSYRHPSLTGHRNLSSIPFVLNAALDSVAERVEIHTADMRRLPFDDGSFDMVDSSLAIHNMPGASERAKALREAARVLRKGDRLMIADIGHTREYAWELEACGLKIIDRRSLGVGFRFAAGPWAATRMVAAIKP